jgi:hypothetical protein
MFSAYLEYAEYEYNISFLKFECHLAIDIGAPYFYSVYFTKTQFEKKIELPFFFRLTKKIQQKKV